MSNMKTIISTLALFLLIIASTLAQPKDLAPGLYAIQGDNYIPLAMMRSFTDYDPDDEEQPAKVFYRGNGSNVQATGKFLLVCDTMQQEIKVNNKRYDVYARFVTPNWFRLIRLKKSRMGGRYYKVTKIWPSVVGSMVGVNVNVQPRESLPIDFEWKKVGRGQFIIDTNLGSGEYAFVLNDSYDDHMDLEHVMDFSIR